MISYLFRRMFLSEFKEILHKDITGKNNPSKIRTTFPIARSIEFLFQYTFNCQLEVKSVVVNSKKNIRFMYFPADLSWFVQKCNNGKRRKLYVVFETIVATKISFHSQRFHTTLHLRIEYWRFSEVPFLC